PGGGPDRPPRTALAQRADPGGLSEHRRIRGRHLWHWGCGQTILWKNPGPAEPLRGGHPGLRAAQPTAPLGPAAISLRHAESQLGPEPDAAARTGLFEPALGTRPR